MGILTRKKTFKSQVCHFQCGGKDETYQEATYENYAEPELLFGTGVGDEVFKKGNAGNSGMPSMTSSRTFKYKGVDYTEITQTDWSPC